MSRIFRQFFIAAFAAILMGGCTPKRSEYCNPVWDGNAPDPTVIRAADGFFYAYTTQSRSPEGERYNIQVLRSDDLVNWTLLGDALPEKPSWASTTYNFWAPHGMEADGKYFMYYSAQPDPEFKTGTELGLCLAVATSDSPDGPFADSGRPMISGNGFINIDPMSFKDPVSGKYYLYWGSGFEPLKVRELSDDLLSFREDAPVTELVHPYHYSYQFLVEGSWVIFRDGWYYLFFSGDNCCGERAHYAVMVARSQRPEGPFEVLCSEQEGDSPILEANERWIAPGHNSVVEDDRGDLWMVYHAIDPQNRNAGRVMLIDRIRFEDGWPAVGNGTPSDTLVQAPFVRNRKHPKV